MYIIFKNQDGTFHCHGRIQDGTERWIKPTLEEAVKSMKQFAKLMNGMKIKKKDITFLQPIEKVITEWVKWEP